MSGRGLLEGAERHAGLDQRRPGARVECDDPLHPAQRHDHRPRGGRGAAGNARATALGNDGDTLPAAQRDDRRHRLGGLGEDGDPGGEIVLWKPGSSALTASSCRTPRSPQSSTRRSARSGIQARTRRRCNGSSAGAAPRCRRRCRARMRKPASSSSRAMSRLMCSRHRNAATPDRAGPAAARQAVMRAPMLAEQQPAARLGRAASRRARREYRGCCRPYR